MRRARVLTRLCLVAFILVAYPLARAQAAAAWDPFNDDLDQSGPAAPPDPAPYVIPEGIYLVTDVYTADVVATTGDTTTYSTTTTHETPGTYARVVDVVGTGGESAFDGASFNDRERLADGRAVGGTYYEDFVLTAGGFVSVNVVFFQDDSETRTRATIPVVPTPPQTIAGTTTVAGSATVAGPTTTSAGSSSASGGITPHANALPDELPERAPGSIETPPAQTHLAGAAVALAPLGPSLDAIEVLRGRGVHMWLRATSDGVAVPVRTWRLVAGNADILSRREGSGSDPCDAVWLTLAAPGATRTLRFEVTSDLVPGRTLIATLSVAVRSPALGE